VKFALFYEIPVARPWNPNSEHLAYQNTLEQAIYGDEMGFQPIEPMGKYVIPEFNRS
jgi:hypothetical protein